MGRTPGAGDSGRRSPRRHRYFGACDVGHRCVEKWLPPANGLIACTARNTVIASTRPGSSSGIASIIRSPSGAGIAAGGYRQWQSRRFRSDLLCSAGHRHAPLASPGGEATETISSPRLIFHTSMTDVARTKVSVSARRSPSRIASRQAFGPISGEKRNRLATFQGAQLPHQEDTLGRGQKRAGIRRNELMQPARHQAATQIALRQQVDREQQLIGGRSRGPADR